MSDYGLLNEEFINKHNLDAENRTRENMNSWFDVIEDKINETSNDPYDSVKDMLVEISAFLGEQMRMELGGDWCYGNEKRTVLIKKMNALNKTIGTLGLVIKSWKDQDVPFLREFYYRVLDSKLPLTSQQKGE